VCAASGACACSSHTRQPGAPTSDRTRARTHHTQHAHTHAHAGHQSDVDVVAWHPNSHYLATGSSDRSLRLWEAASGACVRVLTAQTSCITSLAFSPDGSQLAAGTEDGTVAVYDIGSARRCVCVCVRVCLSWLWCAGCCATVGVLRLATIWHACSLHASIKHRAPRSARKRARPQTLSTHHTRAHTPNETQDGAA
jgi:WD40 repeat protein